MQPYFWVVPSYFYYYHIFLFHRFFLLVENIETTFPTMQLDCQQFLWCFMSVVADIALRSCPLQRRSTPTESFHFKRVVIKLSLARVRSLKEIYQMLCSSLWCYKTPFHKCRGMPCRQTMFCNRSSPKNVWMINECLWTLADLLVEH